MDMDSFLSLLSLLGVDQNVVTDEKRFLALPMADSMALLGAARYLRRAGSRSFTVLKFDRLRLKP